jgi:hypothetical protein
VTLASLGAKVVVVLLTLRVGDVVALTLALSNTAATSSSAQHCYSASNLNINSKLPDASKFNIISHCKKAPNFNIKLTPLRWIQHLLNTAGKPLTSTSTQYC